jgi:integrase
MPYNKISKRQDGKWIYKFDVHFLGKRYRKQVVCFASDVDTLYRQWEKKVLSESDGKYSLFEKFDEYLLYSKVRKRPAQYLSENRTIGRAKKFFKRDLCLHEVSPAHIEEFAYWRKKTPDRKEHSEVSNATVNRDISALSSFFTFCIKKRYYSFVNPCFRQKLIERNQREIHLSRKQIEEMLEKASGEMYTAVLLAIYCGLRRNEIFELKWEDIDFDNSRINLCSQNTKGQKYRIVCMPDPLERYLHGLQSNTFSTGRIFSNWNTWATMRIEWERLRDQLSFKHLPNNLILRFHDLRHVYAQSLRDAGVSLDDIQTLLGHSSVRVTERYAMFGGKDAKEKVNKINNIIPFPQTKIS